MVCNIKLLRQIVPMTGTWYLMKEGADHEKTDSFNSLFVSIGFDAGLCGQLYVQRLARRQRGQGIDHIF